MLGFGTVLTLLTSGAARAADLEPVQILFPYTLVGRVVDADNKAFTADSGITLTVRDAEGNALAHTSVYTPGTLSAWNFRLGVPIASAHVAGYATKGDTLALSALKGDVLYTGLLSGSDARIGEAGASVSIRVLLATDANGNGVADTYEKSKFNWMRRYRSDLSGETSFDPAADYDGDGQSNYAEYLAGTDPFDAEDRFGVDSFEDETTFDEEKYVKLTFETNPGRTYAIRESADLATEKAAWQPGAFKLDPASSSSQKRLVNNRSQWELRTVYLLKQGSQRFYKVELEE